MIVRKGLREDLLGIGRVAEAAHWASYEGLLRPETIGRLVLREFSPSVLARRLLRGGVMVVTAGDEVVGFADGEITPDAVHLNAIATDPTQRRRGIGTALLAGVRELSDALPTAADVLLGNLEGEQFLEVNGFVPGEIQHGSLFSEDVVERRWWREAVADLERELGVTSDGREPRR